MNALVPVEQRRSSAALKAWATRRAQGWSPGRSAARSTGKSTRAEAIATFEAEAKSDCPDWHRAALALKAVLAPAHRPVTIDQAGAVLELQAPSWPDYEVNRTANVRLRWPSPILVVTFADGEQVRAPAVSIGNKPVNVGRGLRVAIAFYTSRVCKRLGLRNRPGTRPAVPTIIECVCEDTGERYDAAECTARTVEARAAQDWKIRRGHQVRR